MKGSLKSASNGREVEDAKRILYRVSDEERALSHLPLHGLLKNNLRLRRPIVLLSLCGQLRSNLVVLLEL